ncbi:hypothetical protein ACPCSP_20175 [Streptomyces cinereoruber]|uniref:hypothetical protein n=1 Tax=Streptomyces cinereoruber TaxID=67260 RepID=UPI003C2F734F
MSGITVATIVEDAIVIGAGGGQDCGVKLLSLIMENGPDATFEVLMALGAAATHRVNEDPDPVALLARVVFGPERAATPVDQAPPAHRFVAEFLTAVARNDAATARELFETFVADHYRPGYQRVGLAVGLAYRAALAAAERLAAQGEPDGLAHPGGDAVRRMARVLCDVIGDAR